MKKHLQKNKISLREQRLLDGIQMIRTHPFFGKLDRYGFRLNEKTDLSKDCAVIGNSRGEIFFNEKADFTAAQWAYAAAHAMLHRAFGHFDLEKVPGREEKKADGSVKKKADYDLDLWNIACDIYVNAFLADIHFGEALRKTTDPMIPKSRMASESDIYEYLKEHQFLIADHSFGTASPTSRDMIGLEHPVEYDPNAHPWTQRQYNTYAKEFGQALAGAVAKAVSIAGGKDGKSAEQMSAAERAAAWFLNHYPLLGGIAAAFKLREDTIFCQRNEISIAAVDAEIGEVYINPAAGLSEEEWRFVLAHEFLHVGLQHHKRLQGRDPYLWNVACDYVINGWLREMGVGQMPAGSLYDKEFQKCSAEEIYDVIIQKSRDYQKSITFRGYGKGDVLSRKSRLAYPNEGVSLDDFFRSALISGLEYQLGSGRGTIPAGMIEEIRALAMPSVPWDVKLADWFDTYIRPAEKHRSYASPSRRQSVTPDIPRPRFVRTEEETRAATFGVVIDTSGSMSAKDIGKALGSIVSYAEARDVPAVRVVFCDADAYDAGYLTVESIAGKVEVKGRGGTKLQPAVSCLEEAKDFPGNGPILIITDGWIENHLTIHRTHAYLLPKGSHLPFRAFGEVFYFD